MFLFARVCRGKMAIRREGGREGEGEEGEREARKKRRERGKEGREGGRGERREERGEERGERGEDDNLTWSDCLPGYYGSSCTSCGCQNGK
jgi:hypothetical protein